MARTGLVYVDGALLVMIASLACLDLGDTGSSDTDAADEECTQNHTGTLCIVNQCDCGVSVRIDGVTCVAWEDEECCRELSSYGGPYSWVVYELDGGWTQSGESYAPECETRRIDVWPP